MIRDTWRAVLVVVTAALLREVILLPRPVVPAPASPTVATQWQGHVQAQAAPQSVVTGWSQPQWHPPAVMRLETAQAPQPAQQPSTGPIRRVARSVVDLADTVLEAIR